MDPINRRRFIATISASGVALASGGWYGLMAVPDGTDDVAPFRTPYKLGWLVLAKSGIPGTFDEKAVDSPFVFSANGRFYMTYVGFDGIGYQTGLAESDDLIHWRKRGTIMPRDAASQYLRYNADMASILRDDDIGSMATLKKVNGRYLGSWHAYPSPGYEAGSALIGLAWSDDMTHWEVTEPILRPEDGAPWERGGLYKSYLVEDCGTYYLFYNAKNRTEWPWKEQTGVATSRDLRTWIRYSGNPIIPNGPMGSCDEVFASDPCVVRFGKTWALYYFGLAASGSKVPGAARDLLALGIDPCHFAKVPEVMVDVGPSGSVDGIFAHKPSIISYRGDLYHFYSAVGGKGPQGERGISVARSRAWST